MSCHNLIGRLSGQQVEVGWDEAGQSFYAQIFETRDQRNHLVRSFGTEWEQEITDIDALASEIEPYFRMTPAVRLILERDRQYGR